MTTKWLFLNWRIIFLCSFFEWSFMYFFMFFLFFYSILGGWLTWKYICLLVSHIVPNLLAPLGPIIGPFNLHLDFWKYGWQLKFSQFLELNFFLSFGTEFLGTEFLRTEFLRTELLRTVFLSYECITLGHRLIFKCNEFTLFALLFILG